MNLLHWKKQLRARESDLLSAVAKSIRAIGNQDLNAFIEFDAARFRGDATAIHSAAASAGLPLYGALIGIKDNIDVAGYSTTAGTPALREAIATQSAPLVERLTRNGGLIAGKTNMHELAFGVTSKNAAFGFVKNPLDTSRSAGGSSGGSAAAVAAGLVHAAIGTDTAGSIRIPAAFCGCVGFRPSTGRYPDEGIVPLVRSRDTAGIIATCVADTRCIDACIDSDRSIDVDAETLPCRLGLAVDFRIQNLDGTVNSQLSRSIELIQRAGVEVVEMEMTGLYEQIDHAASVLTRYEIRRDVFEAVARRRPGIGIDEFLESIASPDVSAAMRAIITGNPPTAADYASTIHDALPALRRQINDQMDASDIEAMIFPTTPTVAFNLSCEEILRVRGENQPLTLTTIRNMQTAPLAGLPSITLPMPRQASELPGGLTLEGRRGMDAELLAAAAAIERLLQVSVDIDI